MDQDRAKRPPKETREEQICQNPKCLKYVMFFTIVELSDLHFRIMLDVGLVILDLRCIMLDQVG